MASFFLDIFCEELPAPSQIPAGRDLKENLTQAFHALGIKEIQGTFWAAPRHLAVYLTNIPLTLPKIQEEMKGPRTNAPAQAIEGFIKNYQTKREDLSVQETPKGTFYFLRRERGGERTQDLLPQLVEKAIKHITWPKSMTWAWGKTPWSRPIQSICCFFDGSPLAFSLDLGGGETIDALDHTGGHRFLCQAPVAVGDPASYVESLRKAHVMVDHRERKQSILDQAQKIAQEKGLALKEDMDLLDEVTGLVEWPVVAMGTIDERFMALPREVLETSMRVHQRYFSLSAPDGTMAPFFLFAANQPLSPDSLIVDGNERVLSARLSDALFFYTHDRQVTLSAMAQQLSGVAFQGQLGSMGQKGQRLCHLATHFAGAFGCDPQLAAKAAPLLKADLVSEIVGEFPELQGVMGKYYARHEGFDESICRAIEEHYLPRHGSDGCPGSMLGSLMALVDRLDTLVGFFGVDLRPTGSKDPFALRRTLLGIIRLLDAQETPITFQDLFDQSYAQYQGVLTVSRHALMGHLTAFLQERLKVYWKDQGHDAECIQALLPYVASMTMAAMKNRLEALKTFVASPGARDFFSLYKRVSKMALSAQEAQDFSVDPSLFEHESEKNLYEALQICQTQLGELGKSEDMKALQIKSLLAPKAQAFFDTVMVQDHRGAIRTNRQTLLTEIYQLFQSFADFSQITIKEAS